MFSSIRKFIRAFGPTPNYPPFDPELIPDPELYYHADGTRRTIACGPSEPIESWRRSEFNGTCSIYAWPRAGGVVIKDDADVIDMAFLGFDRFAPPTHRFDEQEPEEEFARLLRRLGGKWWSSPMRAGQVEMGWKEAEGHERERWFFGWAPKDGSGGVWALMYDEDDERIPGMAILKMAVTMEERCALLEKLGAKFYADPKECEGLKEAYVEPHKVS